MLHLIKDILDNENKYKVIIHNDVLIIIYIHTLYVTFLN